MKIIWIDDKVEEMQNVINYIITSLWDKKIRSKIYIIGETSPSDSTGSQDIDTLNEEIVDVFVNYLINKELINNSDSDDLYSLIYEPDDEVEEKKLNSDTFLPTSNVVVNKIEIFKKIWQEIQANIKSQSDDDPSPSNNARLNPDFKISDDILKELFGSNEDKPILMIDMCLNFDDFPKLVRDNSPRLFSSYLCHLLRQKEYELYMYTSFLLPNNLINHWRKGYKEEFPEDPEVEFFGRDGTSLQDPQKNLRDIILNKLNCGEEK